MAELNIYEPDPRLPEGVDKTLTGFLRISYGAGVQVRMDAGRSVSVILPDKAEPMDGSLYCRSCRALLKRAGTRGYVLLNLHAPDDAAAYPARAGAECCINGYRVTVEKKTIPALPEGEAEITEITVAAQ